MTKLTKTFEEMANGSVTGSLQIRVNYDPETSAVELLSIRAWDKHHFWGIDLTNTLSDKLDNVIAEIDWQNEYRQYREEWETKKFTFSNIQQ